MAQLERREFMRTGAAALAGAAALSRRGNASAQKGRRKMTLDLRCGSIGVRADLAAAIDLARRHGFESVAPDPGFLGRLSDRELEALLADLKSKGLVFGAAGFPVNFRADEDRFKAGLAGLKRAARSLQRAGVTRLGTWISPTHNTLTYRRNFQQHARRLREAAAVLRDHGQRLGLEYVGPKTSWSRGRHPFIHTMAETKELIAEIGLDNVGLVLDSWHWYTAHETEADLRSLANPDVVAVDLNDAPAGIPIDEQLDGRRELPAATGVINLKVFLNALLRMGYDGPVRAEPFNAALRKLPKEEAVAATARAMKKAFALIDG